MRRYARVKDMEARFPVWKVGAITGICLTIIGLGAGYVDESTHFRFAFISDHFDVFLMALLIGIVLSFIFMIGWARQFKGGARARLAGIVFVSPWIAGLLSYPIEGLNVHGPSALLYFLVMPAASLLALVLLIMAGY